MGQTINVIITDDESHEVLVNTQFRSASKAIWFLECFEYEQEQREAHLSEKQEGNS